MRFFRGHRLIGLVGLLLAAVLRLTAGSAEASLSPSDGAFLHFTMKTPVDRPGGSTTAEFFLRDGDRPVRKEEIEVLTAVCRCWRDGETHTLPLDVGEEDGIARFRLDLPARASCNVITKFRYRGDLHVVQMMRTIYASRSDPEDWAETDMPSDTPYLEAEENHEFRTGIPMPFALRRGGERPAELFVYDKDRRLRDTMTIGDRFTYEVEPPPPLAMPGRGAREDVFFSALLFEGDEPLYMHLRIRALHNRRLYMDIPQGVFVFLLAGGLTAAVILIRRRRRAA